MVADVQEPGLAVDDALDLEVEAEVDASPEAEEDPVAALRAELAAAKAELSELRPLRALNPEQINRALGHIPRLQSDFEALKKTPSSDPIAAIDPRLSENESVLSELVDALVASEFLDDSSKAALRQRRQRLAEAQTERNSLKLRQELLKEVQGARDTVQEQSVTPEAQLAYEVANATQRLMDFADGKDVAWDSIPKEALQFKDGETLTQAMARVRKVITDLAGESASTERVTNRRRAAGAGAPAANGANAFRSQRDVDLAHMEGRVTTAQLMQMRADGRYGQLPY